MKKAKKFAAGGMNNTIQHPLLGGISPTDGGLHLIQDPPYPRGPGGGGGGGSGAFGGLEIVGQGSNQIGRSLQGIQQNLGQPVGSSMMKGGRGIAHKKGGAVGSASKRADGIAIKGKTRGKMC